MPDKLSGFAQADYGVEEKTFTPFGVFPAKELLRLFTHERLNNATLITHFVINGKRYYPLASLCARRVVSGRR
jgi:hypothetical protein